MKKMNKFLSALMIIGAMGALASCGGGNTPTDSAKPSDKTSVADKESNAGTSQGGEVNTDVSDKNVSKITVETMPTKTTYFVNDTFSAEGGVIAIEYTDGKKASLSMMDSRVEITAPNMTSIGNKNVTVKFGGKKVTFKVTVKNAEYTLTFDVNYEGGQNVEVGVTQDMAIKSDAIPTVTRTGFSFYNWYADKDCTMLFDFAAPLTGDITAYAFWKEDGATYHVVTYTTNYVGARVSNYPQLVKDGEKARTLGVTLSRKGYTFNSWAADAEGATAFDANGAISADTTIYAKWARTSEFAQGETFVFEAEDTDLTGKTGPGLSGTVTESGMIVSDNATGASGGKYISYLYKMGASLEFYFVSDKACKVNFSARLSAEVEEYTFNPDNFAFSLNGATLDYAPITITNVPSMDAAVTSAQFNDYVISASVDVLAGANTIKLATMNSAAIAGTTMTAHAPLVDCLKLKTLDNNAVLDWNGEKNLPMHY